LGLKGFVVVVVVVYLVAYKCSIKSK